MNITVLGMGCSKCDNLERIVKEIINEFELDVELKVTTEIIDMMSYGVMKAPALIINNEIKFSGTIPPKNVVRDIIAAEATKIIKY